MALRGGGALGSWHGGIFWCWRARVDRDLHNEIGVVQVEDITARSIVTERSRAASIYRRTCGVMIKIHCFSSASSYVEGRWAAEEETPGPHHTSYVCNPSSADEYTVPLASANFNPFFAFILHPSSHAYGSVAACCWIFIGAVRYGVLQTSEEAVRLALALFKNESVL